MTVENLGETNYGPPQVLFARTLATSSNSQFLTDDDCCYRLRTLRITTEDRRIWDIVHCQYLAWGDHGKKEEETGEKRSDGLVCL